MTGTEAVIPGVVSRQDKGTPMAASLPEVAVELFSDNLEGHFHFHFLVELDSGGVLAHFLDSALD